VSTKITRSIAIEIPPSKDYIVKSETIIFDRHELIGIKIVRGTRNKIEEYISNYRSTQLIDLLLGINMFSLPLCIELNRLKKIKVKT
jgi:hypothetical protein